MIVPEKGNGGDKEQKQNDHADHNSDHLDHVDKDDFIGALFWETESDSSTGEVKS